ncbi:MAG: PH domain-containing protein [Kiloniellales bacterium]
MRYVQEVLRPDETIIYEASVHWAVYLPGIACLLFGFAMFVIGVALFKDVESDAAAFLAFTGVYLLFLSPIAFVLGYIIRRNTEVVVTDRRVISKTGWISRKTSEINRDAVESVRVRQSILGRGLGYGTVEIQGRGGGIAPMRRIDDPVVLRNHVYL